MTDEPMAPSNGEAPTNGGFDEPRADALLPARLTPFAPPDPEAEAATHERLRRMSPAALRARRKRIDQRLHEHGLSVGEPALQVPSIRGTGLLDLDRVLRKLDVIDHAREETKMLREAERPDGIVQKIVHDLDWLGEAFTARELRARRALLIAELGLALCSADQRVIAEYAPHVKRLLDQHVATARRVDELFVQARLLDEEEERRARLGEGEASPPKQIERVLAIAMDSVDDVSSKVGGAIVDLGARAAGAAVKGGGHAAWALARGAAKGAYHLGAKAIQRAAGSAEGGDDAADEPEPPRMAAASSSATDSARPAGARSSPPPAGLGLAASRGPRPDDIPELIRKLARLREEGILSEREFSQKKAELLDRL